MKITVVGAGYVGLVTAACLAELGNDVMCIDKDHGRVALLQAGGVQRLADTRRQPLLTPSRQVLSQLAVHAAQHRLAQSALWWRALSYNRSKPWRDFSAM